MAQIPNSPVYTPGSPVYNPGPPVYDGPGKFAILVDACREIGVAVVRGHERRFCVAMEAIPAPYRSDLLSTRAFHLDGALGGMYPLATVAAHSGKHVFLERQILNRVGGGNANIATMDHAIARRPTPLFAAIMSNANTLETTIKVIQVLHGFGANLVSRNSEDMTPMMVAAAIGLDMSIIEVLHELARDGGAAYDDCLDINATRPAPAGGGQWTALDYMIDNYGPIGVPADLQTRMAALGALTGRQVRRRRVCRKAMRVLLLRRLVHARNKWLVERFKAAKARVDFAPGGTGADQAAASFAVAAAVPPQAPPPPPIDDSCDEPPAKRARTQ